METPGRGSITLSFLLVAVATAILYRPEGTPPAAIDETEPIETVAEAPSRTPEPPIRPTTGRPWNEDQAEDVRQEIVTVARSEPARSEAVPGPVRAVAQSAPRSRPLSAFTRVENGESLRDIALRVYGSEDALRLLWQANRDELDRPDDPLRVGMVLRTP